LSGMRAGTRGAEPVTMTEQRPGRARPSTLPAWDANHAERGIGHLDAALAPAHVRVMGVQLDDDGLCYIRRKLGTKLAKFATSIERISVRLRDVNGPRGGVDQVCLIKVVVCGLPSIVVRRRRATRQDAIDAALRVIEQAVRRSVGRRRMKPLHGRASRPPFVINTA
jgi:putative sigma-54 modulation protein